MSFDAFKVTHRVTEVNAGNRYSITLFNPGKLERLTPTDWDSLTKFGFPVYLYDTSSLQSQTSLSSSRLTTQDTRGLEAS